MIKIEKTIFDGKYVVFKDENVVVNNCGIASNDGIVTIEPMFENVLYSVGDWAIVTARYNVYLDPEYVLYGLIDKNMHILINPVTDNFYGYNGFLEIEKIVKVLYEEKYGITKHDKELLTRKLNKDGK